MLEIKELDNLKPKSQVMIFDIVFHFKNGLIFMANRYCLDILQDNLKFRQLYKEVGLNGFYKR